MKINIQFINLKKELLVYKKNFSSLIIKELLKYNEKKI